MKKEYTSPSCEKLQPCGHMSLLVTFSSMHDIGYYQDGEDLGDTEDSGEIW